MHVKVRPEHKEKVIISQEYGSRKFDLIYIIFLPVNEHIASYMKGCFEAIFSIYAIHE